MNFTDENEIEEYVRRVNNKSLDVDSIIPFLLEIEFVHPDGFLMVKETLTRIGIASQQNKKLFQTCHVLHKRSKYYIVHFKELFMLDGRPSTLTTEDVYRRNTIAKILSEWGLCKGINWSEDILTNNMILKTKIISFNDKSEWNLESKHPLGKIRD